MSGLNKYVKQEMEFLENYLNLLKNLKNINILGLKYINYKIILLRLYQINSFHK